MQRLTFHDFDEYIDALGHADLQMMMQKLQHSSWSIDQLELGGIHFQRGHEGCGIISEGATYTDGLVFFMPLSDPEAHFANGMVFEPDSFAVFKPGSEFCLSSDRANEWCSVFIPLELLSVDSEVQLPQTCRLVSKHDRGGGKIHRLLNQLATAAMLPGELPASALLAASGELTVATSNLVKPKSREPQQNGRPRISRAYIIETLRHMPTTADGRPCSIPQLAQMAGVSERTLRTVFQEYYGTNPTQYFQLRQLHAVRRELRLADATSDSVHDILGKNGIWEFSRFAQRYRKLFGELPSATLRALEK